MIDPLAEDLVSPAEATRLFPKGSNGKHPHVAKIYRLMKEGRLEWLNAPRKCTSRQAVARCILDLSGTNPAGRESCVPPGLKGIARDVERALDEFGI